MRMQNDGSPVSPFCAAGKWERLTHGGIRWWRPRQFRSGRAGLCEGRAADAAAGSVCSASWPMPGFAADGHGDGLQRDRGIHTSDGGDADPAKNIPGRAGPVDVEFSGMLDQVNVPPQQLEMQVHRAIGQRRLANFVRLFIAWPIIMIGMAALGYAAYQIWKILLVV